MVTLSEDAEILLLCWAQLHAALLLSPDDKAYADAQKDIVTRLETEWKIGQPGLVARTVEEYTVSFIKDGATELIRFPAEEIEDFI